MTNQELTSILEQDLYKDIIDYSSKNFGVYCYKLPINAGVMACNIHMLTTNLSALYELGDIKDINKYLSIGISFRHLLNCTRKAVYTSTIETAEEVDNIIRKNHKKALEYYEQYSNFKLLDAINAL